MLKLFPEKIQAQFSQGNRIWVLNLGIPVEATLTEMHHIDPPLFWK